MSLYRDKGKGAATKQFHELAFYLGRLEVNSEVMKDSVQAIYCLPPVNLGGSSGEPMYFSRLSVKSLEKKVYCLYVLCPRSLRFLQKTSKLFLVFYLQITHIALGGKNVVILFQKIPILMLMDCLNVFYVLPVHDDQEVKKKHISFIFSTRQHFSSFQLAGVIPCVCDFMTSVLKYVSSETQQLY